MLRFVSGSDVAAEAKMIRSAFRGAVLLVEGDTDSRFYGKYIDSQGCSILPARTKGNVISAMKVLEEDDFLGVVGIVDADFCRIDGTDFSSCNIVMLEVHDLEILLLSSPALGRVLAEYGSEPKIRRFHERSGRELILNLILDTSLPFGLLRYISCRSEKGLVFEGLRYEKSIDRETLKVDIRRLVLGVLALSKRPQNEAVSLQSELEEELARTDLDPLQVCCGHDATAVLCIALRKLLGNQTCHVTSSSNIEAALRLAFDFDDLTRTDAYRLIREWEKNNPPYRVFRSS